MEPFDVPVEAALHIEGNLLFGQADIAGVELVVEKLLHRVIAEAEQVAVEVVEMLQLEAIV